MLSARTLLSQSGCWTILLAIAGCGGCSSSTPAPATPNATGASPTPTDAAEDQARFVRPLLEGWQPPAVALLMSGEMFGYMEPCGCSLTQSGGLERRAHLERMLREKEWNLVPLDAGGLLKRTRRQDQIKFEAILSGLKQLGYTTVGAGDSELRLPPDYLIGQFTEGEGIPLGGLLMACNVVLFDAPELGVPKPWRIIEANGVKIGVTSVVGKSVADNVAPESIQHQLKVIPATEALTKVLTELEAAQPDLLVLMSQGTTSEAKALAAEFPQFPVILAAGGPEDPADEPIRVGDTLILQTGHKGKYVGVLGYYPEESQKFRWELVNLDNTRFHHDSRMHELMRVYQQQLREQELATSPELQIAHPSGDAFVGAKTCGECHSKAFAKWSGTKHAHAFESLEKGRKGQEHDWVSRIYDPECLACHVTGWDPQNVLRYDTGYLDQVTSAHLLGQQCENCHGPGGRHTQLERSFRKDLKSVPRDDLFAARAALKKNYKTAEQDVCAKCHDHENSPNFKFEKYWDEVKHPWKD